MVVDPLASRGVTIEPPSAETLRASGRRRHRVTPARLIDLTIAGTRYDVMKAALDILTTAPEFDLVLAVVGSSARFHPELAVRPIIDSAGAGKPLAAFLVPEAPQALAALSAAGVPSFHTPEACADAIAAALAAARACRRSCSRGMTALAGAPAACSTSSRPTRCSTGSASRARRRSRSMPTSRSAPALPFPYPVAVKVLSADIAHKTDVGGVVLGVADGDALLAAIQPSARTSRNATGMPLDRVLVQPMMAGLGEVLIGYRVDPDVGPLVMVAAGGVLAEIYRDRSLRLAPVDLATAHEMIAEVRGLRALAGYRGRPEGDLDALAQAIVALSQLADDRSPLWPRRRSIR